MSAFEGYTDVVPARSTRRFLARKRHYGPAKSHTNTAPIMISVDLGFKELREKRVKYYDRATNPTCASGYGLSNTHKYSACTQSRIVVIALSTSRDFSLWAIRGCTSLLRNVIASLRFENQEPFDFSISLLKAEIKNSTLCSSPKNFVLSLSFHSPFFSSTARSKSKLFSRVPNTEDS